MSLGLVRRLAWCLGLSVLAAGCSRALPFNFAFTSGELDLRAADDGGLLADLAAPVDQSVSDLAESDLAVADLAVGDLVSAHPDLRPTTDLPVATVFDLKKLSPLGGACGSNTDCEGGAACLTSFKYLDKTATFPGGYCSFPCGVTGTDALCLSLGGHCRGDANNSTCIRDCNPDCPTARNANGIKYGCCQAQPNDMGPIEAIGCVPISFDELAVIQCQ